MESSIKESIKKYKEGNDRERMLSEIISKMTPIINKYARRLYYLEYEDMKQELLIAIIEAVMRIETYDKEGQCINYLVSAVKMRYWELCRKSTNNQDSYANVELLYEYPDKKVKDQFEEIEFANSHFLRPAGPHFPASQGHIKRPVLEIGRAERGLRPANQYRALSQKAMLSQSVR